MKKIFKYVIAFIILIIVFNLLLFLSSLFPSSLIEDNVKKSSERLTLEGNIFVLKSFFPIINNNYTDSIMINECYSIDNNNPIFSYMSVRKNFKAGITTNQLEDTSKELISISSSSNNENYNPVEELSEFIDEKVDTSIEYARYWHGYLPFLRVLLILFDITEIRLFLLTIFFILFITLIVLLKKKIGNTVAAIFAFSLIAYDFFFVSYSLESSPVFITMMFACIILLLFIDKIKSIYLYLFVIGCISNFVDFLTVPLITLAMPLYIYILYRQKYKSLEIKESIKVVILSCITWGCGYSFTWFSKWLIYDILYNKNLINSAISQILYRSSSTEYLEEATISNTLTNFFCNHFIFIMLFLFFITLFLLLLILINKKYTITLQTKSFKTYFKIIAPFLLIHILPIIWYMVLMNHTILHTYFVYRHMLVCLVGFLVCLKEIFIIHKQKLPSK